MKSVFIFLSFFLSLSAEALVNCGPSTCSPACDSSCSYRTCDQQQNQDVRVDKLPFTYVTHASACRDDLNGQVIRELPSRQMPQLRKIPDVVSVPYFVCRTRVRSGAPCPPPPEPVK